MFFQGAKSVFRSVVTEKKYGRKTKKLKTASKKF
jgi:hypothetical protein